MGVIGWQMPMTTASPLFYEMLEEETGLALSDAASALSDAISIKQSLQEQGYRTVEVREMSFHLLNPPLSSYLHAPHA